MDHSDVILNSLKYIEENLHRTISARAIADQAGYSVYYFERVFHRQMGISVMKYVSSRRMLRGAQEIAQGKRILDAALDVGFQSHAAFTGAFKKEYGFSPVLLRAFCAEVDYLKGDLHMSHIFLKQTGIHDQKETLFAALLELYEGRENHCGAQALESAYELSCKAYEGKKRYSGDEYVTHPLNAALLLAELEADEETVIAGLFCDAAKEGIDFAVLSGAAVLPVGTLGILRELAELAGGKGAVDGLSDEAVTVLLADRLHNMRTIQFTDPDQWQRRAKETIERFLPICQRTGSGRLMKELQHLAVKYS